MYINRIEFKTERAMVIRYKKIWILFLIVVLILSACQNRINSGEYKNRYEINVYYKPEEASIFASERLMYKNTEDIALRELYFHIYPNSFKEESTVPMLGSEFNNYPDGFNPGQMDIIRVMVDNKAVRWNLEGRNGTLLHVIPTGIIEPGDKAEIRIDFQEKLPNSRTDFGSFNGVACFENWYPILCVYDTEGWHKEPLCSMGESNFSEVSDYKVEIQLPDSEVVASSGKCISENKIEPGRKAMVIEALDVRDFTWVCSSKFKYTEKKNGNITIRSYYLPEDREKGTEALDFAERSLDFFQEQFGKYPYENYNVVETYLYGGAMEYPMLVSIGKEYYESDDDRLLESGIAHETAHQWWYVVVGNNEYREPWLDEAAASYSEAMYLEKFYGKSDIGSIINSGLGLTRFDRAPGDSLDKFKNSSEYNLVVYLKGAYILGGFRKLVGDNKFLEVMRNYYDTYRFKNASISDFLNIVEKKCGGNAADFIELRLSGLE